MTSIPPGEDIVTALADLGDRRAAFKVATAERRDECVERGDHTMAAVWQGIAVAIAEIEDHERATLAALEKTWRMSGGVMELPG
jgi:hypothetical protein